MQKRRWKVWTVERNERRERERTRRQRFLRECARDKERKTGGRPESDEPAMSMTPVRARTLRASDDRRVRRVETITRGPDRARTGAGAACGTGWAPVTSRLQRQHHLSERLVRLHPAVGLGDLVE